MPLANGTRVGHYEILAPIGEGGMGEVYRARDTKLKRDVALKVLPPAFARDPDRMARFQREAEVLASLNHPNIAAIYGVEHDGETNALAMEFVDGTSPKGPMPFDDAWKMCAQIAEALSYAHERGVIHRDLKPANVKVTSDGVVKLLDFGLAKAFTARATSDSGPDSAKAASAENSPTLTIAATEVGMILGTAAYMAPEQAKGKNVDKRADIWAFGVVLYELLAGTRPFHGEDVGDILASVIKDQPDLEKIPSQAWPLIESCLEKDPKKRLRDIGDADRLMKAALASAAAAERAVSAPAQSRFRAMGWIAAAIFALAAGLVSFTHLREKPPLKPVLTAALLAPDGADYEFAGRFALPALSPDGTRIVFGAKAKDGKAELWVRRLDSPSARRLAETEEAEFPFWSPDSRWVAFGQSGKLKKIDIQGGPPVTVTSFSGAFRGGSWNSQGVILFGRNAGGAQRTLQRVSAAGGSTTPATTLDKEDVNHVYPWFLPDGRHFLYTSQQNGDIPVEVGSLDEPGTRGKVVAQASSNAVYSQGFLLYLRESTLMAQPFDVNKLETTGEAVPVVEGVPTFPQPSRGAAFTVSTGGMLVYQRGAFKGGELVWKDRQGQTVGTVGERIGELQQISISPDGKRATMVLPDASGGTDVWIYDLARSLPTRFTFGPGNRLNPVWSPDGNKIYFTGMANQKSPGLFEKASNGSSEELLLLADSRIPVPQSVSPDGKTLILFFGSASTNTPGLWRMPLGLDNSKDKPQPSLLNGSANQGRLSPDGRWLAYSSNESGRNEVYLAPFPGLNGKRQISASGGQAPPWRRDGKEIYYRLANNGGLMAAELAAANGGLDVTRVQKLFDWTSPNSAYDVTADGQKFLMLEYQVEANAPLTVVVNWPASLRK